MVFPRRKSFSARVLALLTAVVAIGLCWWRPWHPRIVIHERVNPRDGAAMVWVPAGTFRMGSNIKDNLSFAVGTHNWAAVPATLLHRAPEAPGDIGYFSDEEPAHTVYLDGYWIYKNEVTVMQYRAFCRATKRSMPPAPDWGWRDHDPIVNVSRYDATAYASWAGASLPTEAQWEKAARGPEGRLYPWGNHWDPARCLNDANSPFGPKPVGSFPTGASPYGAQEMAGNVAEWCADWYDNQYYHHAPRRNPTGPATGDCAVLRGGPCDGFLLEYRCTCREPCTPADRYDFTGFRCAAVLPGP